MKTDEKMGEKFLCMNEQTLCVGSNDHCCQHGIVRTDPKGLLRV